MPSLIALHSLWAAPSSLSLSILTYKMGAITAATTEAQLTAALSTEHHRCSIHIPNDLCRPLGRGSGTPEDRRAPGTSRSTTPRTQASEAASAALPSPGLGWLCSGPAWELLPQPLTQAALVLLAGHGPPDTQLPLLEAVSHSGPAWPRFQPSPRVPEEHSVGWAARTLPWPGRRGVGVGGVIPFRQLQRGRGGRRNAAAPAPPHPGTVSVPASSPEGTQAGRS